MADTEPTRGWRRAGRHFVLLLWKNFVLAKRTPIRTILEIILPVFFGFLLLAIRHIVKSETFPNGTTYQSFSFDQLPDFSSPINRFAYTPNTNFTGEVMAKVAKHFQYPHPQPSGKKYSHFFSKIICSRSSTTF